MGQIKTEAILLKGTNYRDRSKIITLYTRSHGKIGVVAKGVRDVKSRWGGALQSMAYLNVMFYYHENRTLHLISSADYVKSFNSIYDDFEKMQIGYRIIELVNKTTEDGHENDAMFLLLTDTLCNLNDATKNYVNLLFNFEFRLAEILGFALNLNGPGGISDTQDNSASMGSYFHVPELSKGDLKNIEAISAGNFNSLLSLNISKASEKTIDRFFDGYFRSHIENLSISKTQKVINSKEISSIL